MASLETSLDSTGVHLRKVSIIVVAGGWRYLRSGGLGVKESHAAIEDVEVSTWRQAWILCAVWPGLGKCVLESWANERSANL